MERVAFYVEETGQRLGCLLNPESVVVRRTAGIRPRRSIGSGLTGAGWRDDPLLFTGGGSCELTLDLLFDVTLAGSSIVTEDVRQLTAPIWDLAENARAAEGVARPPLVRFVWGKSWNVPAVVAAVAERLEFFTPEGLPRRSWMRLKLLRVVEPEAPEMEIPRARMEFALPPPEVPIPEEDLQIHEMLGGQSGGEAPPEPPLERLDEVAGRHYQDPSLWKLIATFNGIDNPLRMLPGLLLRIPPLSALSGPRP